MVETVVMELPPQFLEHQQPMQVVGVEAHKIRALQQALVVLAEVGMVVYQELIVEQEVLVL
jgi:hypothetical protein